MKPRRGAQLHLYPSQFIFYHTSQFIFYHPYVSLVHLRPPRVVVPAVGVDEPVRPIWCKADPPTLDRHLVLVHLGLPLVLV